MASAWVVLKLVYLYLQYFLVGLVDEGFQIQKGNYFCELGLYEAAAKAYERALRETQAPLVHYALGYCYLCMGLPEKAAEHLQKAYARRPLPDIGVTLLQAFHENDDAAKADELYRVLKTSTDKLSSEGRAGLAKYEEAVAELSAGPLRSAAQPQGGADA